MSTDRQRVKRAIQRIAVQAPELRSLLEDAESKGGKPKSAGVGGGAGSAGGNDAQETRICCDGSVSDDGNPGVEERDPQDGDQDGLNPDDPADLSGLDGGCLTGVTDCDTGDAVCFCGDDWLPPDRWDSPTDPPVLEGWFDGFYWQRDDKQDFTCCRVYKKVVEALGYTFISCSLADESGSPVTYLFDRNDGFGVRENTDSCFKEDCSGTFAPDEFCSLEEDPKETEWPSDSCTNLAIKGGKIVGSKYDPENDGSWSAPRDEIHLCDGADDIYLKPSANGGWKSIDSTKTSGYLYSKNFELVAHIDGNEYSDPAI